MTHRLSPWLVALALVALAGCAGLAPPDRTPTTALGDTAGTRLGRAVSADVAANPGKTGIHAMPNAHDAFAARALFAAAAEKSLDAQYYLWHGDQVGNLLFEALWQAAERGVRVRLLLDDINTAGLDPVLAALDAHPRIEVRLYNPLKQRDARVLAVLADFARLNRRMHNKSFTVDNQVAVVGGRNIGDEYFGAAAGVAFADLDVVVVGAAVPEVSREFDVYWNSASAYPAAGFVGPADAESAAVLEARFASSRADPRSRDYLQALRTTPLVRDLLGRKVALEWTSVRVLYDDPAKTLDASGREDLLLFPELARAMGRPERTLDLVSPYFVPGDEGTDALVAMAKRGVRVRVLTNSLASSDVSAVHAGYAKRRAELLRAGVRLFELRPTAGRGEQGERLGIGTSSSSGLHAKTFAVDGQRIFVGSFNFDQRSARLNTEMGLAIDSPTLARSLGDAFDATIPLAAWEVRLAADGKALEWVERSAAGERRHEVEPGTTWFKRSGVQFLSVLPIEWLL